MYFLANSCSEAGQMGRLTTPLAVVSLCPEMKRTPTIEVKQALDAAAKLAAEHGLTLETFMPAAWAAFMDHNPGLRERLERERVIAQIDALRERGLVAEA